jgi:hypothetical protein
MRVALIVILSPVRSSAAKLTQSSGDIRRQSSHTDRTESHSRKLHEYVMCPVRELHRRIRRRPETDSPAKTKK